MNVCSSADVVPCMILFTEEVCLPSCIQDVYWRMCYSELVSGATSTSLGISLLYR